MKIILRVVITIAMMLALAGCHNKAQRAVLVAADSLLNSAPDSALNLVETLDPADLSTDTKHTTPCSKPPPSTNVTSRLLPTR